MKISPLLQTCKKKSSIVTDFLVLFTGLILIIMIGGTIGVLDSLYERM